MMIGLIVFLLQATQPTTTPSKGMAAKKEMLSAIEGMDSARSTMIINPKLRAADYQKAYELLRREKSTSKVYFQLADGSRVSNVIDMKLMPNDTLVVFRYSTPQGIRFQVVEIENIVSVMHQ